jgi:glyoxylase-like metal-dependent hydrolase (beta-lactamase superfamily II)
MAEPAYEVTAIRYGSLRAPRSQLFHDFEAYGEPDAELEMAYFFWLLRDGERTVLVDTGFDPAVAARRGRSCEVEPLRALAQLGVAPESVDAVVITHFHYDHIGNLGAFAAAEWIVPAAELDAWSGSAGEHVEAAEVELIAAAVAAGRARTTAGEEEVLAGVRTIEVGGHSPGQLLVVVSAGAGSVVLTSDAVHFYEELERDRPFAVADDLAAMRRGYERVRELARAPGAVVVAGHDPLVADRFPASPGRRPALWTGGPRTSSFVSVSPPLPRADMPKDRSE